ncbi:unnamed protein product [Umbelopsis sp. WA50703]
MPSTNPSSDQQLDSDSSDLEPHVTADNAVHELEQQLDQQQISKEDSNSEHEHGTQGDTSPPTMEVNINNQEVGQQDTTDRTIAIEEATDEYLLKEIDWINPSTGAEKRVKIITQNKNGPCPLVAIGNVLLLRGDIRITPFDRPTVTFEYLASQLGEYLLSRSPTTTTKITEENDKPPKKQPCTGHDISQGNLTRQMTDDYVMDYRFNLNNALSIIPNLRSGLDINVYFNSIYGFEPTKELALFDLFHVDLVHGWVVDPEDNETQRVVVDKCGSYNSAVERVISSDIASQQQATKPEADDIDTELIHTGLVISQFLESSATQLTYHGLQLLMDSIPKGKLCVFFRNNHHPELELLYTLVTDSGFVYERALVWESLEDVDQSLSRFYDSWFCPSHQSNVEYTAPSETAEYSKALNRPQQEELDYALALSLEQHNSQQTAAEKLPTQDPKKQTTLPSEIKKKKRTNSCIVS